MADFALLTGLWLDRELHSADSTILFTSTRRAQAVNDGYVDFCNLTECLTRKSTVACSCSVREYDLLGSTVLNSTDFIRIAARGLEYHLTDSNGDLEQLAGDDFPRRDIEWLNKYEPGWRTSTTPQMPTGYYVDDSDGRVVVGLDFLPDVGSSETAKLLVPYVVRPALMTASNDVPFTVAGRVRTDLIPLHQALTHYAAHDLEKLRGDDEASDRQYAKYQMYVQRFTQTMRKKGGQFVTLAKNYLRSRQHDGSPAWTRDPRRYDG